MKPLHVSALVFLLLATLLLSQSRPGIQAPGQTNLDETLRRLMLEQGAVPDMRIAERRAAEYEFDRKWNRVFAGGPEVRKLHEELSANTANPKSFERVDAAIKALQADPGWLHEKK